MGYIDVHVYRANNNDQKWADKALSALNDVESQVDFTLYTYDEGSVSLNIGGSADAMLDNWENYIESNDIYVNEHDVHLLAVNTTDLGAGALRGGACGPYGATPIANSEGTAGFVNAAVRFDNSCYGGQETYPPTVIHEWMHAVVHIDMNLPEDNNEHSIGSVYNDADDSVSPAQLWYTGDPCSGNYPPNDNCNSRASQYSEGVTNDMSSCAVPQINDYVNSF